jgi:ribose 5-phosphate isomerase A
MTNKECLAKAVLSEIHQNMVLGIGTGSTVDCLIDLLPSISLPSKIVSSSVRSTNRLKALGIEPISLNEAGPIDLYIDGADQVNASGVAIKGLGGAMTLEKILATASSQFIAIITEDKWGKLTLPVPIEVMPEARSTVARVLVSMGGVPILRLEKTEHGNVILDTLFTFMNTLQLEEEIKLIPGVIESGLFSKRQFDKVYIAKSKNIDIIDTHE